MSAETVLQRLLTIPMVVAGARKYAEIARTVPSGEPLAEIVDRLVDEVEWQAQDLHRALEVINAGLRVRRTMLRMRQVAAEGAAQGEFPEEYENAAAESERAYADWLSALVEFESAP